MCPPPWPTPPFPRFNRFVPPPDYPAVKDDPHKVTAEKVLDVIMDELKSIIRKDITRRMIEGVAFKSFDDWWDCQEKKTRVSSFFIRECFMNSQKESTGICICLFKMPLAMAIWFCTQYFDYYS